MAHKLVVLEWLYKADQDFGFAKTTLKEEKVYFDQICFHFHQSTEKYLKAYIIAFGLKFEKQHDLERLLEICRFHDSSLEVLKEECQFLTPFYIETRYPDEIFSIATKKEADEAYLRANKIRHLIRKKIGIQREIALKELEKESQKIDKILKKKSKKSKL